MFLLQKLTEILKQNQMKVMDSSLDIQPDIMIVSFMKP